MKSPFLRFLLLVLLGFWLVTACSPTSPPASSSLTQPPLTVAYSAWPGFFPLAIAQEKDMFAEQGGNVQLTFFENYFTMLAEFNADKYDGIALSLGSLPHLLAKNPDVQVVLIADESSGADVIVAQSNIQTVADLKGKQIGVKFNDFGELFVATMLKNNGLTVNDVKLVNLEAEEIPEQLQNQIIQAGHTWEPFVFQSVKAGAKILFTSKQTPGLIPDIIAFHGAAIRDRPERVKAFIQAWFQAQDYWKANPEAGNALIAQALKLQPEAVTSDGIRFYTLQDNLQAFTPGSTAQSLYHTTQQYVEFSARTGALSAAPDLQALINPSFIQQLQGRN